MMISSDDDDHIDHQMTDDDQMMMRVWSSRVDETDETSMMGGDVSVFDDM